MPQEKKEETDKGEQEESKHQSCNTAELVSLPLIFPRLCFASHILMLTYSYGASAILKLLLNRECFGCSSDEN